VQKVYGGVLNIHIAAFALTSLNLLAFLIFILRPFMNKVRWGGPVLGSPEICLEGTPE
jgi:hypothetical protein